MDTNTEIDRLQSIIKGYELRLNNLANQYSYVMNALNECEQKYETLLDEFNELKTKHEQKSKLIKKSKSLSELYTKPSKKNEITDMDTEFISLSKYPTLAEEEFLNKSINKLNLSDHSQPLPEPTELDYEYDIELDRFVPLTETLVNPKTKVGGNPKNDDSRYRDELSEDEFFYY